MTIRHNLTHNMERSNRKIVLVLRSDLGTSDLHENWVGHVRMLVLMKVLGLPRTMSHLMLTLGNPKRERPGHSLGPSTMCTYVEPTR